MPDWHPPSHLVAGMVVYDERVEPSPALRQDPARPFAVFTAEGRWVGRSRSLTAAKARVYTVNGQRRFIK